MNKNVNEKVEIVYDYNEVRDFIAERTGLSKDIIESVLDSEVEYMRSIGIIAFEEE